LTFAQAWEEYCTRFGSANSIIEIWPIMCNNRPDNDTLVQYIERCLREDKPMTHYFEPAEFPENIVQ
jgi:hypothetical protein